MDSTRVIVYATVGIIVAVTIASGPLVPWVDFTVEAEDDGQAPPGSGTATVTVLEIPRNATLDRGEFGAGSYYLHVPEARLHVEAVSGRPLLAYKLRIRELGHSRVSTYALDKEWVGERSVTLEPSTLSPDEVTQESYPGELLVVVRGDRGERTLVQKNVTVHVER